MLTIEKRITINVRKAYAKLPHGRVKAFKEALMEQNKWTPSQFYLKMNGQWSVSDSEVVNFIQAFTAQGINIETAEYMPNFITIQSQLK